MMRQRTKARIVALQFLYQIDVRGMDVLPQLNEFVDENAENKTIGEYAKEIISGCVAHWDEIECKIQEVAQNWTVSRMAVVDRTILRIAVYEMSYQNAIPHKVVINEAIELGKSFSTSNSGAFINGILDNLKKEVNK